KGRALLISRPDCPRLAKGKGEPKAGALRFSPGTGIGLPSLRDSSGLGSKRSTWLGPPSRNTWMTCLTLGAKWVDRESLVFGVGLSPAFPRSARMAARARPPNPEPALASQSRRLNWPVAMEG